MDEMNRRRWMAWILIPIAALAPIAAQCGDPPPGTPTPETIPTVAPTSAHLGETLTVVFPTTTTTLVGGQSLRVTVLLVDGAGQPVEEAMVEAELRAPGGHVFTTLICVDKGQGRYLADPVQLPLRGAGGTWRVVVQVQGGARAERTFQGRASYSEDLQRRYGFWIVMPNFFSYGEWGFGGTLAGLHRADESYEDGGGYVILSNYRNNPTTVVTVALDVHWRRAGFPSDETAAITHVRSLAPLERQAPDIPSEILAVETSAFQGRPAWRVTGQWRHRNRAASASPCPIEWLIFACPGSGWLWSLAVSADDAQYMDDLRVLRETFECPAAGR